MLRFGLPHELRRTGSTCNAGPHGLSSCPRPARGAGARARTRPRWDGRRRDRAMTVIALRRVVRADATVELGDHRWSAVVVDATCERLAKRRFGVTPNPSDLPKREAR